MRWKAWGPRASRVRTAPFAREKFHGALDIQTSNGPIELDEVDGAVPPTVPTATFTPKPSAVRWMPKPATAASRQPCFAPIAKFARTRIMAPSTSRFPPVSLPTFAPHTNNSGITIRLAEPVNVRVSARTSNGSVSSDFDARVTAISAAMNSRDRLAMAAPARSDYFERCHPGRSRVRTAPVSPIRRSGKWDLNAEPRSGGGRR